jgi:hypothetical protein
MGSNVGGRGTSPAEPPRASDGLQRPLRFRFQPRLTRSVRRQSPCKSVLESGTGREASLMNLLELHRLCGLLTGPSSPGPVGEG